ncbi:MAG: VOC family protein [Thermoleophilia bacterium]|nr:VOC family protein [Thermoleophilia bacterium]
MWVAPLLVVADVSRSLSFWRDAVGGTVLVEWETYAHVQLGEGELHLATPAPQSVDKPDVELVLPSNPSRVTGEVVLHVEDVVALATHLESCGILLLAPPSEPAWGGERRCFLRDPDGHLVELTQTL